MAQSQEFDYEHISQIVEWLKQQTTHRPQIGIICGSGLSALADMWVDDRVAYRYSDIPYFPVSTVCGHKGNLVFGKLNGKSCVFMQGNGMWINLISGENREEEQHKCMPEVISGRTDGVVLFLGRFHPYEGYDFKKCAMPVRVMKLLGVETLIVTNAAGGLNPDYNVGDIMVIKDQINLPGFSGNNPLHGPNDERFGPRFPAMNRVFDSSLRRLASQVAKDLGYGEYTREGVYVMLGGPTFETPAEARLLRLVGADAVGMSTAHEIIVAVHSGMKVLGISLITDMVAMDDSVAETSSHEEVLATGKRRSDDMKALVAEVVRRLDV